MKAIVMAVLTATTLWNLFLKFVSIRSEKNPIPDNVKDVYDDETYKKWTAYHSEKIRLDIIRTIVAFAVSMLLIAFDFYALFDGRGLYLSAILVTAADAVISLLIGIPADWHDTMVIEEKYGFNKSTRSTFAADAVKNFIIELIVGIGLTCLYAFIHSALGDAMILLFAGILFLFVLGVGFLSPLFLKIFNRFTPLEEGELRARLTGLLEKNGYSVREIKVMDASRRSTKSNAMFTGFGKSKTIILYDNLVNNSDTDEICAVFAHEMGHGIHKDTLKLQAVNFVQILVTAVLAWLAVKDPEIYGAFGFSWINYGFAVIIMGIFMGLTAPVFGLIMNAISRHAEYRADRQAAEEGYGKDLINALKKLSRDNFSNPAPSALSVFLEYSHPTTSQRITAIEKAMNKAEKGKK